MILKNDVLRLIRDIFLIGYTCYMYSRTTGEREKTINMKDVDQTSMISWCQ